MLDKTIIFYVFTGITTVEMYHILVGYGPASAADYLRLFSISQILKQKAVLILGSKIGRNMG